MLAGAGGTTPDAQAFLRGMGGREVGLATGLLLADRGGASAAPWLLAGVLFDSGDVAGIARAWHGMEPAKRVPGIAMAAGAALAGVPPLAPTHKRRRTAPPPSSPAPPRPPPPP